MNQNQLLKISFVRTVAPKTKNPTMSESFTKTNQKWPRLEWKRNYRYLWCHIWQAHLRNQIIPWNYCVCFKDFLAFIDLPMCKIDRDPDVLFKNVQIQPCKFKTWESGNDSVDINLSGSDSDFSQVRKGLGKISSSRLANFILCQGILKENQIKLKYSINGISKIIFLTKK